jgi:hypothetical protein
MRPQHYICRSAPSAALRDSPAPGAATMKEVLDIGASREQRLHRRHVAVARCVTQHFIHTAWNILANVARTCLRLRAQQRQVATAGSQGSATGSAGNARYVRPLSSREQHTRQAGPWLSSLLPTGRGAQRNRQERRFRKRRPPPPAIHLKPGREARMTARTAISSNSDLWGSTVGFAGEHSSAGPGRQLPSNLTWCRSRLSAAHGIPGAPVDCSGRVHAPSCRGARYVSAPKSIMGPMRRRAAQARPPG